MITLSIKTKERVARLIRYPMLRKGLGWGVRLFAPRQRVGVVVVLLDSVGRVLMLRHVFHPTSPWGLPGGWLGRDENPAVGALRELREETGLSAEIIAPVLVSHERHPAHIGLAYLARPTSSDIVLSGEILEARWAATDELPEPLLPIYQKAIAAALAYEKNKLSSFEEITENV